jgi:hypothetical protein
VLTEQVGDVVGVKKDKGEIHLEQHESFLLVFVPETSTCKGGLVVEKLVVEEVVVEKLVVEELVVEKLVVEELVVEKLVVEKLVVEELVVEEHVSLLLVFVLGIKGAAFTFKGKVDFLNSNFSDNRVSNENDKGFSLSFSIR